MKIIKPAGSEELGPRLPHVLFDLITIGRIDVIEWHLSLVGLRKWLPSTAGTNFL